MTTIQLTEVELSTEVQALETKISELETHVTFLQNQVTLVLPLVSNLSTSELIEQAKLTAILQQDRANRLAEITTIQLTLEVLKGQLENKRDELTKVRREEGFELLKLKALEVNTATNKMIELLREMEQINRQIQGGSFSPLSVLVNLSELPYCDILPPNILRVRGRAAIIEQQRGRLKNIK